MAAVLRRTVDWLSILLRLRRALTVGALHLLARLEDFLLRPLLATPRHNVLGEDKLSGIELGRLTALDLGVDVVGDGAAGWAGLDRHRTAAVGEHHRGIVRDGAALLHQQRQEAGSHAGCLTPAGRFGLLGIVCSELVLESGIEQLPTQAGALLAHALPLVAGAHGLRTRRRRRQAGVGGLVAGLTGLTGSTQHLLRVALAGVDGVSHQLVAVLLRPKTRLIARRSLRRSLGDTGAKVQRTGT